MLGVKTTTSIREHRRDKDGPDQQAAAKDLVGHLATAPGELCGRKIVDSATYRVRDASR